MRLARRIEKLPSYLFVEISRKIAEKRAQGEDVISLAIGDPDIPTPAHIIETLCEAAHNPDNHRYPETDGLPQLRKAVSGWYERRFGITFDPDREVLPLIGSKEGIGHIALCLVDPGDLALVTDPGYPVYSMGTLFAGGECYSLPLLEENEFLPDLDAVPSGVAKKAKVLWINYPNNPTSATADSDFFDRVVAFAGKHEIAVCHDAPYTEVAFDGYRPRSFMQARGARDVGVEFHSLSKSYNMTGWRIGMVVGSPVLVDALARVKSNLDSGIPQAIQHAGVAALQGNQDCISEHNSIYERRRDLIMDTIKKIGLTASPPRASLYVWARVPKGYTSAGYCSKLLDEAAVIVTPGSGYGKYGEGYIRISLTTPDERLEEGLARMKRLSP
ncbi:MAG: LL-diaminopimelate aminotransferase [Dehalococcoidia bacterium]|nr:LL-diaminopimelate aminotransferase [Dehalococcoidia bacterium]